jgi:hypothetical protein
VTPDTRAQLGGQGPADGSGPRELLRYRSAQGRWVLAAMIVGTSVTGIDCTVVVVALPAIGRNLHGQNSWICAAAFGSAAALAATFITGPGRPTPTRGQALIQTPVPHLTGQVAFPSAPEQTRPDSSQASGRSFAADAPSPSRPG